MLLHSRFGILLLVKISLYLVMVLSAAFRGLVIGPQLKPKRRGGRSARAGRRHERRRSWLRATERRGGRPCSGTRGRSTMRGASRFWKQGSHMGRHQAGQRPDRRRWPRRPTGRKWWLGCRRWAPGGRQCRPGAAPRAGVLLHGLHESGDRLSDRADPGPLALVVTGERRFNSSLKHRTPQYKPSSFR